MKPKNYAPNNKVWLNSKYIKIIQNWELKAKFFKPFWIIYLVGKQAYKFELTKKWKIHNIFYVLLLEQNITRKKRIKKVLELNIGKEDSKEYKVKTIQKSAVYTNKSKLNHLSRLYYLIIWKGYLEEKNI